ncbi:hypothetical protein O181_046501 [Austropuccinia psidii MF-1]|uniref:Uncharacterized protein n=1 Tax=Austropuccinia psidii MF-1 TaxID=1389203 RepID=A0A9Q3HIP5_9BASI|nr:hypothetical protein [Austropuccinia psidii MF-1]
MSLKAKTHINTIDKVQVITPHGARQQFGMLIFVHEITYTPPPDHLTPLTFLLPHMNQLLHPRLILPGPYHAYTPAAPSRYASAATPPCLPSPTLTFLLIPQYLPQTPPSPLLMLPPTCPILSSAYHPNAHSVPSRYASDASTTPYASAPPPYLLFHLPTLCSHSALNICL